MIDMGGNGNNNPRQPPGPPPPPPPPPPPMPLQQCPRCNSFNTKFCYYNNHCASQPRYLCKSCRRYWTQGGSIRNVPNKSDQFKGCKWLIKGGLAFGVPSSCSSSFIGESSRSHEQPLPPSLLPLHMRGSLPFANNSFGESFTNFSLWQGFSGNPNSTRPHQGMVPRPHIISRSGPSGTNNRNQSPDDVDVDVDDYLNDSPPPPSSPSSSS